MISTVLFDADGVLINAEMASYYFARKYNLSPETTVEFYKGPFQDCITGKLDAKDVLPPYLKKWGWQKSVDDFMHEWFEYEHKLDEELIAYVQKLRQKGIKCYVATNQDKHRAQYMLDEMGFKNSFDGLFASAHLGVGKPEKEFFEKVLDKLGVTDKETILFWDDRQENVSGAREFGINAELYTDIGAFKSKMLEYGL